MLTLGNIVKREHFRRSQCSMVNVQWSMFKNAIKREQSQACLDYAEREHFRRSQWSMVNGLIPPKKYLVVDDRWQLLFIVCHHDERLVLPLAERLDDVFHQTAVPEVQTVQRLVQYQ